MEKVHIQLTLISGFLFCELSLYMSQVPNQAIAYPSFRSRSGDKMRRRRVHLPKKKF